MRKTKSKWLILGLLLSIFSLKSQTCSSPITLTVNGAFTPIDSTLSTRYFKFNANSESMRIKFWIKNYSLGNYQVKLFPNDCANIPNNLINTVQSSNGDSLTIIKSGLSPGVDYLIELSKVNPSSEHIVYKLWVNQFGQTNTQTYGCSPTCGVPSNTCELVCNGSFECLINSPYSSPGNIGNAYNWVSVTGSTPDLFAPAAISTNTSLQVPCNYWGTQNAQSGNNYCGIYWHAPGGYNGSSSTLHYTEYIQTQLTSTMVPTKKYNISFYISKSDFTWYPISQLGVYITTASIVYTPALYSTTITEVPKTIFNNAALLNNTGSWVRLSFCYTAAGGEKFIAIGRPQNATVSSPSSTATSPTCSPFNNIGTVGQHEAAYLYIDNVSVQLMDFDAGPNITICPGTPTVLSPTIACNSGLPNTNLTFSWTPSTALSSNTVFAPTTITTNTITYSLSITATGDGTTVCTFTDNITVNTFPSSYIPPTPSISASSAFGCIGGTTTLTAAGGAGTYTWHPGPWVGNPYVVSPITSTNYTVVTGSTCTSSATYSLNVIDLPCDCIYGCTTAISGTISSNPSTNAVHCVTTSIVISGAITFTNADFRFAPYTSINVPNGSTLTIAGCHLYSCGDMWQGIEVEPGGVLNCITSSSGKTTFIEDAYVAINIQPYTLTVTPTTILNVNNVTFNRNQVAIKINKYDKNQTTYPFTIANSLFTSRTITFTPLSWPTTNTVKNTTFTPSSPLQTPYLNNTTYPLTTLKNPLSSIPSGTAIILNDVGFTSVPSAPAYKVINIGQTGASNYNVFDNHYECITANNSNVTVFNSIFQNGVRYGRGAGSGGKAIVATSTQPSYTTGIAVNNQIRVVPGSGTSFFNKFYDMTRCIEVNGYLSTEIAYNEVYSYTNAYPNFTSINTFGGIGFVINTNRYFSMKVNNNKMYNIKNCVQFDIGSGDFVVGSLSGSGRYIGSCNIFSNTISKHPTTPVSNEYVNIGVSVNDAFTASSVTFGPVGGAAFSIYSNTMTNVHNGIGAYNIAYTPVTILSNSITMALEPNTWYALPAQGGINAFQMNNTSVHLNNITGPTTYTVNDIRAIKTSMNSQLSVKCNTTSTTGRGLDFNASQPVTTVQDNIMQNQTNGLSLDNNGVIGTQGNTSTPTNNQWLGTWTAPNYKTFTYGAGSSAQFSPFYIQYWLSNLDPDGNGWTTGVLGTDEYYHSGSIPNLYNVTTTLTPSCRLGGGGGGGKLMGQGISYELAEDLVLDSISYSTNVAETRYIDKNRVYKMIVADAGIKSNSGILNNFSLTNSVSAFQKYNDIEEAILSKKTSQANGLITSITPVNNIESNYKKYYQLLLKAKTGSLNSNDSTSLFTLANSCPFTEGGSVYQARALYNQLFSVYLSYNDNCTLSNNRLAGGIDEVIKVIFNTSLYPNPTSGEFSLKSTTNKITFVEVMDINGKVVYSKTLGENKITLQPNLNNGIYLIRATLDNGKTDLHRLVITK